MKIMCQSLLCLVSHAIRVDRLASNYWESISENLLFFQINFCLEIQFFNQMKTTACMNVCMYSDQFSEFGNNYAR